MRFNHLKALKEGKTMDKMPIVTLKSGLRVGNFSSPHEFKFVSGEVLAACSPERARALMLDSKEEEVYAHPEGWTDIVLEFSMSEAVKAACRAFDAKEVDVVIVPLPVMESMRRELVKDGFSLSLLARSPYRVCRVADRVTKTIYGDKFCL